MATALAQSPPILLNIIQFLDVPTLLSFRLLCKSTFGLISEYQISISRQASQSLWHKAPGDPAEHLSVYSLKDLIRLHTARQLAIQATTSEHPDAFKPLYHGGFSPNDAMGDALRDCVTRGFMLVHQLSMVQNAVQERSLSSKSTVFERTRCALTGKVPRHQKAQETFLINLWRRYTDTLAMSDLVDFRVMIHCLVGKMRMDNSITTLGPAFWLKPKPNPTGYAELDWLMGYLLRQGIICIKRLWSTDDRMVGAQILAIRKVYQRLSLQNYTMEGITRKQDLRQQAEKLAARKRDLEKLVGAE
ncbi:MAG: hypothetical protein Q9225_007888 [Loekoesia sp. 1 TL-2023]